MLNYHAYAALSSQAKGTKSTSFLACMEREVNLVPLPCEDDHAQSFQEHVILHSTRTERNIGVESKNF